MLPAAGYSRRDLTCFCGEMLRPDVGWGGCEKITALLDGVGVRLGSGSEGVCCGSSTGIVVI